MADNTDLLNNEVLEYFWEKLKSYFAPLASLEDYATDADLEDAKQSISSSMSGKINSVNGKVESYYNLLKPAMIRVTVYVNAQSGNDDNSGDTAASPKKTIAGALGKYPMYSNIRLQLAAGTYDIGTMTAENKKIALVGASAANTTLNGRINLTSCTLTLSALTVVADGTTPIVTASTGSHVYGYRANFISTGGVECLRVTTASQCYLDGSVFVADAETDIVVRSSGGSVTGLGYCSIPGLVCASTTGEAKLTGCTIKGTKIESGGVIFINGSKV